MSSRIKREGLARELAGLPNLDRQELLEKWRTLYGSEAPARIRQGFLIRAIAYRMQENALGGLKPATKRILESFLRDGQSPVAVIKVKAGTRLIRQWHGVTYEVLVMDDGVMLNGRKFRSLSEVAYHITGSKRSGPLFFGLKGKGI